MLTRRQKLAIFLLGLVLTFLVALPAFAAPKLSNPVSKMYVGQTLTLKVSGASTTVKWSSSDKTVATVFQ